METYVSNQVKIFSIFSFFFPVLLGHIGRFYENPQSRVLV
jgi:hypothetical protein